MSVPANIDLTIQKGEDYVSQFYWLDSSDNPFPVVNPAYMMVKPSIGSGTTTLKLKTTGALSGWIDTGIQVSGTTGFIQITLTAAQTLALTAGIYVYDLFVSYSYLNADGTINSTKIAKVVQGKFVVNDSVTVVPV